MKVLFVCFSSLVDYHFYTELEIIKKHINKKDIVDVLHCGGILDTCFFHKEKTLANCFHCIEKFKNNTSNIENINNVQFIKLNKSFTLDENLIFKSINDLKKYKLYDIDFGMAVASSLISIIRDHDFDTLKHRDLILKSLKSSIKIFYAFKNHLKNNKPDLVYVFNGRFSETRPIVRLCQKENIPFYTHERGANIYKYELFENTLPHDFDYIFKEIDKYWNKDDKEKISISENWIKDRISGVDTSWYSFIKNQDPNSLPTDINQKKRIITIFNSSEDEFAAIDEKIKMPFYNGQFDAIKSILEHFKENNSIHFYLRVHPNLINLNNTQTKEIELLKSMNFNNLTIIEANSKVSTYSLITYSEKIITFGSTVGIEAVYLNKPSIMIGNALYESLNCVYMPKSEDEFLKLIENIDLKAHNRETALKYGYWESTHGYEFKYFKPENFSTGTFMGKKIDLYWYQIIIRKFLSLLHKLNPRKKKI